MNKQGGGGHCSERLVTAAGVLRANVLALFWGSVVSVLS